MWYPSIIKNIWPQWNIRRIIKEEPTGVLVEVEEKSLGESSLSLIEVISLSTEDEIFSENRQRPDWAETSFLQTIGDTLQKIQRDSNLLKERSFEAPVLRTLESELVRREDGPGWYLLLRRDPLPTLEEVMREKPLTAEDIRKIGIDISSALELYEELHIIHGAISQDTIYVTPGGEYRLGGLSLPYYLKREAGVMMPGEEGKIYGHRQDIQSLSSLLYQLMNRYSLSQSSGNLPAILQKGMSAQGYDSAKDFRRALEGDTLKEEAPSAVKRDFVRESVEEASHRTSPQISREPYQDPNLPPKKKQNIAILFFVIPLIVAIIALGAIFAMRFINKSGSSMKVDVEKIPQITNRSFVEVKEGEEITLTLYNGKKVKGLYYGEMKDGKPEGRGAITLQDEAGLLTYSGEWKNGLYHGKGMAVNSENQFYIEGDFVEGKVQGKGLVVYSNGVIYEGDFYNDYEEGEGKQIFPEGDIYEGSFKQGKREGSGMFRYANGNTYVGQFSDNEFNGEGTFTWTNGGVYTGSYVNSKRSGYGTLVVPEFGTYNGEFKDDLLNGKGTYVWNTGDTYTGDWVNDKRSGTGRLEFASGNVYEGEFNNDVFHGHGTMTWFEGDLYEGRWVEGQQHGIGEQLWNDGSSYKGEFVKGVPSGDGTKVYPNGDIYTGEWSEGERNGEGSYLWKESGENYVGSFKNGMQHGSGILYDKDGGILLQGVWDMGVYQN